MSCVYPRAFGCLESRSGGSDLERAAATGSMGLRVVHSIITAHYPAPLSYRVEMDFDTACRAEWLRVGCAARTPLGL